MLNFCISEELALHTRKYCNFAARIPGLWAEARCRRAHGLRARGNSKTWTVQPVFNMRHPNFCCLLLAKIYGSSECFSGIAGLQLEVKHSWSWTAEATQQEALLSIFHRSWLTWQQNFKWLSVETLCVWQPAFAGWKQVEKCTGSISSSRNLAAVGFRVLQVECILQVKKWSETCLQHHTIFVQKESNWKIFPSFQSPARTLSSSCGVTPCTVRLDRDGYTMVRLT